MWTLDNLPVARMRSVYGFTPSSAWIDHVMHASLRIAGGCSASFVSPDGLVMTNHHCVAGCLNDLEKDGSNYVGNGYPATRPGAEPRCPGMELNQLTGITDVTKRMTDAMEGKSGADQTAAEHATEAAIESQCTAGHPADTRCDVIALYHGGRYDLYKYRRYSDVRLVFSPEDGIANFGGDPDNFNYPRYDLDMSFVRAFEGGKPVHSTYFAFDPAGPKDGELVFTSGNPGSTSRDETADQIEALHDEQAPLVYGFLESYDGTLTQFATESAARHKEAVVPIFGTENALKVYTGWLKALGDPALLARRRAEDKSLLDWIDADAARRQRFGNPFDAIKATLVRQDALYPRYTLLEGVRRPLGFASNDFAIARALVRAAAERQKPDADRLPAFRDAKLPALKAELFSTRPIYPDLETTTLGFSLVKLRQILGADDSVVRQVLGRHAPEDLAHDLVAGTHVADLKVREALWSGGQEAIDASTDPMIRFAVAVDAPSRAVLKQWQDEVEAPQRTATVSIAKARFARDGNALYPDATFTERLSYGKVAGWTQDGQSVAPFTDFAGLYARATGSYPFALPKSWLDAEKQVAPDTKYDFVTTNDIIGGNSGSPMIDRDGHVIGLVFDGNQASIAGNFIYDGAENRTVAVDTASMVSALRHVYKAGWLVNELLGSGGTKASD